MAAGGKKLFAERKGRDAAVVQGISVQMLWHIWIPGAGRLGRIAFRSRVVLVWVMLIKGYVLEFVIPFRVRLCLVPGIIDDEYIPFWNGVFGF